MRRSLLAWLLLSWCLVCGAPAHAKSWAEVARDVSVGAGETATPDGEWTERRELLLLRGATAAVWTVVGGYPYVVRQPTERPGVFRVISFLAVYHDGRFVQSNLGDSYLEGMPPIDLSLVRSALPRVLARPPHDLPVRQILSVERVPDSHDHWRNFQVVQIPTIVRYTVALQRPTGPALAIIRSKLHIFVSNTQEDGYGAWQVGVEATTTEALDIESERPVTAAELAAIPTLDEAEFFADFPAGLKPAPQASAEAACAWLYHELRGPSSDVDLKWRTYAMYHGDALLAGQRPMPNAEVRQFIEQTTPQLRALLRAHYPEKIAIDHFGDASRARVYFRNHGTGSMGTCMAVNVGATWMVSDIQVPPAR